MLTDRAKKIVTSSAANKNLAFIVEISPGEELRVVRMIPDPAKRRAATRELYSRAKEPVFTVLSSYSQQGIRIVNPLDGTLQLIASGPASAWEKALDEQQDFFEDPNLSLVPNEAIATAY